MQLFEISKIDGAVQKILLPAFQVPLTQKLAIGWNRYVVVLDGEAAEVESSLDLVDCSKVLLAELHPAGFLQKQPHPGPVPAVQPRVGIALTEILHKVVDRAVLPGGNCSSKGPAEKHGEVFTAVP